MHETSWAPGRPKSRRIYDQRGRLNGKQCDWDIKGTLIACFAMVSGSGTVRNYEHGRVIAKIPMRNGKRHGVAVTWDPGSFRLKSKARYRHGTLHGRSRAWRNGCLWIDEMFRNGELHGRYKELECDARSGAARMTTIGRYCRDKRCGTWSRENTTGSDKRRFRYDADGRLVAETTWHDGRVVNSWDADVDRAEERAKCLAELKRGGCCFREQSPPRGAKMCFGN